MLLADYRGGYREDGYFNVLKNYGTRKDSSTAYYFEAPEITNDQSLTNLYMSNGLFARIIDAPAETAVSSGFETGIEDSAIEQLVFDALDDLRWEQTAIDALAWTRLYGGAIGVMLVDDGGRLEQPLNRRAIQSIEEIVVFERPCVTPDRGYIYTAADGSTLSAGNREPERFLITSINGSFYVHRSRCLIFKAGSMPEQTQWEEYRYWGVPEYLRIKDQLKEAVVAHSYGFRMLEKSVQAVYKMQDLATKMMTDQGEKEVLSRMDLIDLARGMLNTIVVDKDGEDYTYQTASMAGVSDVIASSCNILSAVSKIPQTILFGRSPAGMNATGESDLENWYKFVEGIQARDLYRNLNKVIDVILLAALHTGKIQQIPKYHVEFKPLWSLSEQQEADLSVKKAQAAQQRASTAQIYHDLGVMDSEEIRRGLQADADFDVERIELADKTTDWSETVEKALADLQTFAGTAGATSEGSYTPGGEKPSGGVLEAVRSDGEIPVSSVGVLVLDESGRILTASRTDGGGICGPGGHIEPGETPEVAAVRESIEEFGIVPQDLRPLCVYITADPERYCSSQVYVCTKWLGFPRIDEDEMTEMGWRTKEECRALRMFPPFSFQLDELDRADGGL